MHSLTRIGQSPTVTRLIPIIVFLLLSAYYLANAIAIIWDSARITGGFGGFEVILLLWALAPWVLLTIGLAPRHDPSESE